MNPDELLKVILAELASNELWLADAGTVQRPLDERVTRLVIAVMKRARAIELSETDEQNLLAAVQMAGLGHLDQAVLDSGAAQRVYDLACEVADALRAQRETVARRHRASGQGAAADDIEALLEEL